MIAILFVSLTEISLSPTFNVTLFDLVQFHGPCNSGIAVRFVGIMNCSERCRHGEACSVALRAVRLCNCTSPCQKPVMFE